MILTSGSRLTSFEYRFVKEALDATGTAHFNDFIPRFEDAMAKYTGAKYAIATNSGTSSMHLGLLALGISKDDEVILPDMTYISCANVIHYIGAKPVFVDIDPITWCISETEIEKAITPKTKAIMTVCMYGNIANMDTVMAIAKKHKLKVIEDACPAVGTLYKKKHAGTIGDVGALSFQGAKILAIGEGGMALTNDGKIAQRIRKLQINGRSNKREFWHDEIGFIYMMSNIQAALGLGQAKHIEKMVTKKQQIFSWYTKNLQNLIKNHKIATNQTQEGVRSNYWMPSIIVENQKKVRKYLKKAGIDTRPFFYPISDFGLHPKTHETPNAHYIGLHGINLPGSVNLTKDQVDYICQKPIPGQYPAT